MSGIMVCGDIHGDWRHLNTLINKRKPDMILQCGDFGYWPSFHNTVGSNSKNKWNLFGIKNPKTDIHFCDGNHEDHWALKKLKPYGNVMKYGVFYMGRGSTLKLPDGRRVMFFGGANSIDKASRTLGVDWFPEEVITYRDLENLPDEKVDIIISHTCPEEFDLEGLEHIDPSKKALSYILDKYRPDLWYFAHFHEYRVGSYMDCKWKCLNMASLTGWWEWIETKKEDK